MTVETLMLSRKRRLRRRTFIIGALAAAVLVVYLVTLMVGNTFYSLGDVFRVIAGQEVQGASFTVGQLRLPRATLAVLAGLSFGLAGVTFQTMLRNPLASPDIIGISEGATVAAVFGIIVLGATETQVSVMALVSALLTATLLYWLSDRSGFAGTRLILMGIGAAAFFQAITAYVLTRAREWDVREALQWISGSLNGATWDRVAPVALACLLLLPAAALLARQLSLLQMGDDASAALGLSVRRARIVLIVVAVVLLAFATAATGPILFVAFMAGPIAARIMGSGGSLLFPAALVGALLVLLADLAGQFAFDSRYPVGVITGVLGAPFLLYLLIRVNRSGGSL